MLPGRVQTRLSSAACRMASQTPQDQRIPEESRTVNTTDQSTVRSDDNVWHIPADRQEFKACLGLKFRSMCGLDLRMSADAPIPTDDAPTCPACTDEGGSVT